MSTIQKSHQSKWSVVYEKAIRDDGSLFFPQKLTKEFLQGAQEAMGLYVYTNQYLNEIIPSELQTFKKEWFRYYDRHPRRSNTFIHIDPAISQADGADFTGVVVVDVDPDKQWFVKHARRYKITPTQIIDLIFQLTEEFKPSIIGVEDVAYQKALLYMLDEEMRRRNVLLPVKGVHAPTTQNKQSRILGALVPRIQWGRLFFAPGLHDLELELLQFPRGSHDDLIDALASIEYIQYAPDREDPKLMKPRSPNSDQYERWIIQQMKDGKKEDIYDDNEQD